MTTYDDRDLADDELAAALGELALLDRHPRCRAGARSDRRSRRPPPPPPRRDDGRRCRRGRARGDGGGDGRRPSVRPHPGDSRSGAPASSTPDPVVTAVVDPTVPATTTTDVVVDPTVPPATSPMPPPAPTPARYDSTGGSISVRIAGGVLVIDGEPRPAPGWSVRVDDDGPTRVRVRFERDDRRSEIRIDLVDGRLRAAHHGRVTQPTGRRRRVPVVTTTRRSPLMPDRRVTITIGALAGGLAVLGAGITATTAVDRSAFDRPRPVLHEDAGDATTTFEVLIPLTTASTTSAPTPTTSATSAATIPAAAATTRPDQRHDRHDGRRIDHTVGHRAVDDRRPRGRRPRWPRRRRRRWRSRRR